MIPSLFRIAQATVMALAVSVSLSAALAQTESVPDDVVIRLERTSCFGECPVYTVSIDAKGNVTYDGANFVRVEGRQTDRIPVSRVLAILDIADRIGFFDLRDRYRTIRNPDGTETMVTDMPTAFVTITRAGRSKRVEDYLGAPRGLKELEQQIDETARTKRWIRLDERMLQQLLQQGWFPSEKEGPELLRKAVQHDDVGVVKGLLAIGVDPNVTYYGTKTPPLMMVLSAATARALLDAGASSFARNDNGGTSLGWAAHLAPAVTDILIKAGAPVDQPSDSDGRTPLWQAACLGNLGVVNLLLSAAADPGVRANGVSALECARRAGEAARLRSPSIVDIEPPYVPNFDAVIGSLEQALLKRKQR
jgi:hypothetical protein